MLKKWMIVLGIGLGMTACGTQEEKGAIREKEDTADKKSTKTNGKESELNGQQHGEKIEKSGESGMSLALSENSGEMQAEVKATVVTVIRSKKGDFSSSTETPYVTGESIQLKDLPPGDFEVKVQVLDSNRKVLLEGIGTTKLENGKVTPLALQLAKPDASVNIMIDADKDPSKCFLAQPLNGLTVTLIGQRLEDVETGRFKDRPAVKETEKVIRIGLAKVDLDLDLPQPTETRKKGKKGPFGIYWDSVKEAKNPDFEAEVKGAFPQKKIGQIGDVMISNLAAGASYDKVCETSKKGPFGLFGNTEKCRYHGKEHSRILLQGIRIKAAGRMLYSVDDLNQVMDQNQSQYLVQASDITMGKLWDNALQESGCLQ